MRTGQLSIKSRARTSFESADNGGAGSLLLPQAGRSCITRARRACEQAKDHKSGWVRTRLVGGSAGGVEDRGVGGARDGTDGATA